MGGPGGCGGCSWGGQLLEGVGQAPGRERPHPPPGRRRPWATWVTHRDGDVAVTRDTGRLLQETQALGG